MTVESMLLRQSSALPLGFGSLKSPIRREPKANEEVASFLFNSAKNGNVSAQIFWLKTRAKWRETPLELRHSGAIGKKDLSELTDEELIAIIGTLSIGPVKTIEASAIPQPLGSEEAPHAETNGTTHTS